MTIQSPPPGGWGPAVNKDFWYLLNPKNWTAKDRKYFGLEPNPDVPEIPGQYMLPVRDEPIKLPTVSTPPPGWENSPAWKATQEFIDKEPDQHVGFAGQWDRKGPIPKEVWGGVREQKPAGTDFERTKFMQKNREQGVAFENQQRWDDSKKKFVSVGSWQKEQKQAEAKKAKHE